MKKKIDYIFLDDVNGFEFGLVTHERKKDTVEMIVIHHESTMVRTIGYVDSVEEALIESIDCIQRGFVIQGLCFEGQINYSLPTNMFAESISV